MGAHAERCHVRVVGLNQKIQLLHSIYSCLISRAAMRWKLARKLLEKLEATLTAAAFAEEREVEKARRIMAEPRKTETGDA